MSKIIIISFFILTFFSRISAQTSKYYEKNWGMQWVHEEHEIIQENDSVFATPKTTSAAWNTKMNN